MVVVYAERHTGAQRFVERVTLLIRIRFAFTATWFPLSGSRRPGHWPWRRRAHQKMATECTRNRFRSRRSGSPVGRGRRGAERAKSFAHSPFPPTRTITSSNNKHDNIAYKWCKHFNYKIHYIYSLPLITIMFVKK